MKRNIENLGVCFIFIYVDILDKTYVNFSKVIDYTSSIITFHVYNYI